MQYKPNLDETIERMRRFWSIEEPLYRVPCWVMLPRPPSPTGRKPLDATFYGRLDEYLAYNGERFRRQSAVLDDFVPAVCPPFGHALIPALLGCGVQYASDTLWSIPSVPDLERVEELRLDLDNDIGRQFRSDLDRLLDWADGRCAVSNYEMEGVTDIMAALRGTEKFCCDFYETPELARRFARRIADLLIEWGAWNSANVAGRQAALRGAGTMWFLWMPPSANTMAEDHTVLLSPGLYRDFIIDEDRRMSAASSHMLLEVHPEGNRHLQAFGEVDGITAMSVENPLRMAPEHREMIRPLLGRKALVINCSMKEARDVLAFTGTRGVFLITGAGTVEEANAFLRELSAFTTEKRSYGER